LLNFSTNSRLTLANSKFLSVRRIPSPAASSFSARRASRIRYRLQLFNNLPFDQLDRLRIEVKMKILAESN
jgi:hypothetical protein